MQKASKTHRTFLNFVLSADNVKRLGPNNAAEVEKLTLKNTEYLFGDKSAEVQLEENHISLGVYNEEDNLTGVVCLNCFPNIPALPPFEWSNWLLTKYRIDDIIPMTTLWIHYAVWDRRYTTLFLKPLLQYLFQYYEPLEHVVMVCPPGITTLDFIAGHASRAYPVESNNQQKVQSLYITRKNEFVPQYVIRRAVEEDNDDLVAIIPPALEETYGHYYISEILSSEETQRQIIVAEHRGCAVGVLCVNESVNYDLLNEQFELVPFNGFKKYNDADEVARSHTSLVMPQLDESMERLSTIVLTMETKEEEIKVEEDDDDDEFSLVNLSSSMILNFLYEDDEVDDNVVSGGSATSIESHLSAVVLNEDYQDHLYNADRSGDTGDVDDKRFKHRERTEEEAIPVFYGEPNAFAIEICVAVPEHQNCLYLLFQAAFQCFPDRDYIVVSFPTDSKVCYLTKHFARAIARCNSVFQHELYVLHKSSVLGSLSVRPSIPQDKRHISWTIKALVKSSIIMDMFKEAVDVKNTQLKAYTFLCEKQVVGCAIVAEETEHEYLQLQYNVDAWTNTRNATFGSWGNLEHFLLSPIFHRNTRFFLRELHRLSSFDALFFRFKSYEYLYSHRNFPIANCLSHMVPVLPNPLPQYSDQITDEYQLPQSLQKHHQPFGLYMTTMRLTSMERVIINQKIVVVGAGATAIAFLEALIFGSNSNYLICFTNVTVVSPHGVAYHKQPSALREMIFVSDGRLDRKYMDRICLRTYVHVVTGVMTGINRRNKFVTLNDDSHIPYDYMFLMCGEQFQKPPIKSKEVVKKKQEFPSNVFIINTEADAGNSFNALKHLTFGQKQGNMVVFGHYLEACCCLATLLELGVPGSNLVYVDPSPDHTPLAERHDHLTQFFNNAAVETAVLDEILLQGVTIYQDYNFVEWHMNSNKNVVTSAKFESKYKFVEIELSALFIYHSKGVSTRTFQAIAKSGLVFNGRLIIDKNCQTNDPYIYGAGPLTMYSKKYYAEHMMHKFYNPLEIGTQLGYDIRRKLVPEEFWDAPVEPVKFHKPVVQHCRFPGNLYYLQVSKPGQPVPLDVATIKCNYGRVLTTGDCKKLKERGYFRLHLNQFQTVETITCLAKSELHVRNLIALWGKHEVLLNHLVLRYDLNMITDFYEYFAQPWAAALYHRDFPRLYDNIFEILQEATNKEGVKLVDEVRQKLESNHWNPLTRMQIDEVEEICRDSNLIPVMEQKVLDFLHDNYVYLPMYANQLMIRWIIHEIKTSPLFVKTNFMDSKDGALHHPFVLKPKFKEDGKNKK